MNKYMCLKVQIYAFISLYPLFFSASIHFFHFFLDSTHNFPRVALKKTKKPPEFLWRLDLIRSGTGQYFIETNPDLPGSKLN